jgi:hypothetical protein
MIEIRKTDIFAEWLDGLRDIQGRARIQARIERLVPETLAMSSLSEKVCRSCESTMAPVTGCISRGWGKSKS